MYRICPQSLCACLLLAALAGFAGPAPAQRLRLNGTGDGTELQLGSQPSFHKTDRTVTSLRWIEVPGADVFALTWSEVGEGGRSVDFFAISLDGSTIQAVKQTSYTIKMKRGSFDPLDRAPTFDGSPLPATRNLYIVQFVTQPLQAYRDLIDGLGGKTLAFIANHSHVVRMDDETRARVQALPFVRWIGEYHSEYRTEPFLIKALGDGTLPQDLAWYNLQFFERGPDAKAELAGQLTLAGADVSVIDGSSFMNVAMTPNMLRDVISRDEILYVDRYFPSTETAMDIVRNLSGANYLESLTGFTGQGVRAEVADTSLHTTHQEFGTAPLFHGQVSGGSFHGTAVTSILFADGVNPLARGMLPDGQIIFAGSLFNGWTQSGGGPAKPGGRWGHTKELVDPNLQWKGVLQTNSTGSPLTLGYTVVSAQMDEIVFDHDIVICQAQFNNGTQKSGPQAWGKNVIGVGGIRHENTLTTADDSWSFGASIGPAEDGRIKPDLAHFFDNVSAANNLGNNTYTLFAGTSCATPITAGHFGLFFQMWHQGLFGNAVGATLFDSKPHFSTAKAMLINTASQWTFSGTSHDLTRVHQGWGRADVQTMYDLRNQMLIVDEDDVLSNLQTRTYNVDVSAGEPALKATLVYADIQGMTSSSQHRINDLSLKVTSPSGTVYWGNNGLLASMWSTPGGAADDKDTVENVFVQNPEPGTWMVEVTAGEVNVDTHIETPQTDADYALVVSGLQPPPCPSPSVVVNNGIGFNPLCFSSLNSPALGTTWNMQVDATAFPNATWSAVWCRLNGGSFFFDPGEVLVSLQSPVCFNSIVFGSGVMNHSHPIPNNPALAGQSWVVQGLCGTGDQYVKFCNALDVTIGCGP